MRADLHIHTRMSDGSLSPQEIVKNSVQGGLELIAITDHDTFSGFREAMRSPNDNIRVLAGIEFSTFFEEKEIHILGYFPSGIPEVVEALARESREERIKRVKESLRSFEKIGIRVDYHEVEKLTKGRVVTRNHLANALVRRKIVPTVASAFSKYLSYEHGIVPPLPNKTKNVIEILHEGGGKAVLAHPELGIFDTHLQSLVSMGLDGVEVYGRKEEGVHTYYFERVSEDFDLLKTGGSDFHGYERHFSLGDFYVTESRVGKFLAQMGIDPG